MRGKFARLAAATMISTSLAAPFAMAQDSSETAPVNDNAATTEQFLEPSFTESIGLPVDFNNPWWWLILPGGALAGAALWQVLRHKPVRPKVIEFGPLFLLENLDTPKAKPDNMRWEKLLWMAAVASGTIAATEPEINDRVSFSEDGDVLIAADTGYAAATNWTAHKDNIRDIIRYAHNDGRQIAFLITADAEDGSGMTLTEPMSGEVALSYLENIQTVPWEVDLEEATSVLEAVEGNFGATYWMSNGLLYDGTIDFAQTLESIAPLTVYNEDDRPHLVMPAEERNGEYRITIRRADAENAEELSLSAYDQGLNPLGTVDFAFEEGSREQTVIFNPDDHRIDSEDIFRFSIDGERSAGATILVSDNYLPRTVGIATQSGGPETDSYLSETFYLYHALEPYTEIEFGTVEGLLENDNISILILPDATPISDPARASIENWTINGGLTIRMAGPNLARAEHTNDPLLPVDLRRGSGAVMARIASSGGTVTLQDFENDTPFAHITPDTTITVSEQIYVRPSPDLEEHVWARFSDNSPLVTADNLGDGTIVLFHTTATPEWSQLSLSENFVEMLVATVEQGNSIEDTSDYTLPELPPIYVLNSQGELRNPGDIVAPLTQEVVDDCVLGPENPPGLYGTDLMQVPWNLSDCVTAIHAMDTLPENIEQTYYTNSDEQNKLQSWLWLAAIGFTAAGVALLGRKKRAAQKNDNKNNQSQRPSPEM